MKKRKLKPFVAPMIYTISLILLVACVYVVQAYYSDSVFSSKNNTIIDANDSIDNDDKEDVPVVSTDTQIIRPYTDTNVKIVSNYYNYEGTNEEQENSILYYENTYMQNSGIDYALEDKSSFDVVSILDGTVSSISDDDILGKIVEIKYSNDLIGVYQSMGDISVAKDDNVAQGSVIGTSGESNIGTDIGNHLHFELYYQGVIVNPEDYFGKLLGEL